MVTFEMNMGFYDVKLNGKRIGCIQDGKFFTSDTFIHGYTEIEPEDLRKIADYIEGVRSGKYYNFGGIK
jgi:hypothetical protein